MADFVKEGCVKYSENSAAITDAILSSDGTTLAISSEDGVMRFYQVYLHAGENPRCLHQWKREFIFIFGFTLNSRLASPT